MVLANIISEEFSCLGLEFLGKCSYDPSSPSRVYFSIGQAISALALLLAFTQLLRPIIKFRLKISFFKLNTAFILFCFAIIFVFLAAALPFIPGAALPLLGYPIFWEFLAGLLFAIGTLGFLWVIIRPAKFTSKNYKIYFNSCASLIAKGNDNDLRDLAEEIRHSIKKVISAGKKYDRHKASYMKKKGEKYEIPEYSYYALNLLDIWSDAKFCEVIVCHDPFTAIELVNQIEEQYFYDSGGYSLVNQIISQAYLNKTSILYKEEDFVGLGHYKTFTNAVFGNYSLIESIFRPLEVWWKDELKYWQLEKYCDTIQVSIKAYFNKPKKHHTYPLALEGALSTLNDFTLSENINLIPETEISNSKSFKKLNLIQRVLREIVKSITRNEKKLPKYKFIEEQYEHLNDNSIYGIIAYAIFTYYENLSSVRSLDEVIRTLAVKLWTHVYPMSKNSEPKSIQEIQKRLNIHLFKKVEENLIDQSYPALTRLLINIIGLPEENKVAEGNGIQFFKNKFFELLCKHYENAFNNNYKKALDMIPTNTEYNKENGQLIQIVRIGRKPQILNLR